ncbi:acetyltransferase, GNAT family [Staphylococcus epidermidis VCU118]|nr:acetyltransferase, GNAT family [Staphylococcus epidermidis VCU118]
MEEIARHLKKHDTITPKIIRTNQYNTNSIKLAQRLGYNYDANWDDVINKGDCCFLTYKRWIITKTISMMNS